MFGFGNAGSAMRALHRRLRRLEARLDPPDDPEGQRRADSLRGLIRRRCEKTGHPYLSPSPEFAGQSLTEIARACPSKMHERQQNVAPSPGSLCC